MNKLFLITFFIIFYSLNGMESHNNQSQEIKFHQLPLEILEKIVGFSTSLLCDESGYEFKELDVARKHIITSMLCFGRNKLPLEIKYTYIDKAIRILRVRGDIGYLGSDGTLLIQAIKKSNPTLVRLLLKYGEDPNEATHDWHENTPLLCALYMYNPVKYSGDRSWIDMESTQAAQKMINMLIPVANMTVKDSFTRLNPLETAISRNLPLPIIEAIAERTPTSELNNVIAELNGNPIRQQLLEHFQYIKENPDVPPAPDSAPTKKDALALIITKKRKREEAQLLD